MKPIYIASGIMIVVGLLLLVSAYVLNSQLVYPASSALCTSNYDPLPGQISFMGFLGGIILSIGAAAFCFDYFKDPEVGENA